MSTDHNTPTDQNPYLFELGWRIGPGKVLPRSCAGVTLSAYVSAPSFDFGLFIAYVLPGVIVLYGLSLVVVQLADIFRATEANKGIGTALVVTLLSLLIGRVVSVGRAVLLDASFRQAMPLVDCTRAPYLGGVKAVEPDYLRLADSDRRESFRLAVANEQRPYQFGGNTAIALMICAGCWLASLQKRERYRRRVLVTLALLMLIVVLLYGGARKSHYRFARALAALNGQELHALNRLGQPCTQTDGP